MPPSRREIVKSWRIVINQLVRGLGRSPSHTKSSFSIFYFTFKSFSFHIDGRLEGRDGDKWRREILHGTVIIKNDNRLLDLMPLVDCYRIGVFFFLIQKRCTYVVGNLKKNRV